MPTATPSATASPRAVSSTEPRAPARPIDTLREARRLFPIGSRLREVAALLTIPYQHLANRAGISRAQVSRVLRGKTEPSWQAAQAIAKAAGVTVEELRQFLATPPSTRTDE